MQNPNNDHSGLDRGCKRPEECAHAAPILVEGVGEARPRREVPLVQHGGSPTGERARGQGSLAGGETVVPRGLMLAEHKGIAEYNDPVLPFGYYLERDADLLVLCRSDGSLAAAFSARGVDPFEVEATAWDDAD